MIHLFEFEVRNVALDVVESGKSVKVLIKEQTNLNDSRHHAARARAALREKRLG